MSKKVFIGLLSVLVLIGGLGTTVFLVKQNQDTRSRASTPGGQTTVSLSPASGSLDIGTAKTMTISFNPNNIPISAVAVRLQYSYSGSSPEVTAGGIQINQALLGTGDWTCPVKTVTPDAGKVKIDIACANTTTNGFTATSDTPLATFTLTANQALSGNLTVSFDPQESIITKKDDGTDVLLTPASRGSYTIAAANNNNANTNNTNNATGSANTNNATGSANTNNNSQTQAQAHNHKACAGNACSIVPCNPATTACADTCTADSDCQTANTNSNSNSNANSNFNTNTNTTDNTTTTTSTTTTATPTVSVSSLYSGQTINNDTPTISGTTTPNAKVVVTIQSTPQTITTYADTSGNWTIQPSVPLANGTHTITIVATGTGGQAVTETLNFSVDTTATASATTPTTGTAETTLMVLGVAVLLLFGALRLARE